MISVKQIIKKIGNEKLTLTKGDGYWYFSYYDNSIFETHSVYTMYLNDMSLDEWVEEGKSFVNSITG